MKYQIGIHIDIDIARRIIYGRKSTVSATSALSLTAAPKGSFDDLNCDFKKSIMAA